MKPGHYVEMRYSNWEDEDEWHVTGKLMDSMTHQEALDLIDSISDSRYTEGWEYRVIRVEVVEPEES